MKIIQIEARDIPDAWFQCINKVQEVGFKYEIQQGSFVGQTRLEFDWITVKINHPYNEPYDLMLPDIPAHLNIPNPVAAGYVEQYLPYLMTDTLLPDEQYTYGSRIFGEMSSIGFGVSSIDVIIGLLKRTPNTNQAILQIGQPSDCRLTDPPCLRHIDMRVKEELIEVPTLDGYGYKKENKLIFYPYFRSWDLWGGFPANLAAIAVLQKYMADEIGVLTGPIIASSKGLHLYGYVEELARIRCNKGENNVC